MVQFEKTTTTKKKNIAMEIKKLLKDSDLLIAAPELNERLQGKIQNIFIILLQSFGQRGNGGNTVKCQASFLAHLL